MFPKLDVAGSRPTSAICAFWAKVMPSSSLDFPVHADDAAHITDAPLHGHNFTGVSYFAQPFGVFPENISMALMMRRVFAERTPDM